MSWEAIVLEHIEVEQLERWAPESWSHSQHPSVLFVISLMLNTNS